MSPEPFTHRRLGTVLSRRSLLAGTGLTAAAIGGLTGCGAEGNAAGDETPVASVTTKTADVPVGSGTIFAQERTVITQPTAGEFRAFSSICTHAGCPVASVTDTINCNCHGSRFAIADGSVVMGPATRPLPARTVQVSDGTLTTSR